jgi:2-polyprenyl-6-methoxyphenol hydroxylase-like FAD-dependent oxidoreductase
MSIAAQRVVVIGGGVAGLATALSVARSGHETVVVERDAMPPLRDGDEAFDGWARPSVPQWRQVHNFSARVRTLLAQHLPDVLDVLRADGIEEINPIHVLLPAGEHQPDDHELTGLVCRRPAFEWALRRVVEAEPGVRVVTAAVASLELTTGETPAVVSVRLADGTRIAADLVVDAAGRRTPVPGWLSAAGVAVPLTSRPCELIYYSRYFRAAPGHHPDLRGMTRGDLGYVQYWTFVGDHRTYGAVFGVPTWDRALRDLRHDAAWTALVAEIPALAAWLDGFDGTALHGVQVMANHHNTRREYVTDDQPLVTGLVAVGDALSTTNPMRAWGAAMALTHAFAVAPALAHPDGVELAHHRAVSGLTRLVHDTSATTDRLRSYRWRGLPVPADDIEAAEHESLVTHGVLPSLGEDPYVLRAMLRSMALVDAPNALLRDPRVVERARRTRAHGAAAAPAGSDRERALAVIGAAIREVA